MWNHGLWWRFIFVFVSIAFQLGIKVRKVQKNIRYLIELIATFVQPKSKLYLVLNDWQFLKEIASVFSVWQIKMLGLTEVHLEEILMNMSGPRWDLQNNDQSFVDKNQTSLNAKFYGDPIISSWDMLQKSISFLLITIHVTDGNFGSRFQNLGSVVS